MTSLAHDWTHGLVAILDKRGRPVGTGFVAGRAGLVITCDHVLDDAGWSYGAWDEPVRIWFKANGARAEARVNEHWYRQAMEGDIAVLELQAPLPAAVTPLPLAAAAGSEGHKVATFGYPEGYVSGLFGAGEVRGSIQIGGFDRLQLWSDETTKGYSGGPVWDVEWERVIGMVLSGRKADDQGRLRFTWFAVPVEALAEICDRLSLTRPAVANISQEKAALWVGVPPMLTHFLGREALLAELVADLTGGSVTLAVEGLPGVGKSSLAVALAHDPTILTHFRDGILWARLGLGANAAGALASWADALGVEIAHLADEEARTAAIRNAIGQRRLLLIIDDAWELAPAAALRCGGPNCSLFLTTRDMGLARAFAGAGQARAIPVLADEPAFALLEQLAPEACAADVAAARGLAQAVGGLPLALELLGGYLAAPERSLIPRLSQAALARMTDPAQRLKLAAARLGSGGQQVTLAAGIALSVETLRDTEAGQMAEQTFYALGAFAPKQDNFSWEAAEAVTGVDVEILALLAARNLVTTIGAELTLHQTVADVARSRVAAAVVDRHRDYYLALVNEDREDWQRIEAAYGQIQRAWQTAPADSTLLEFAEALATYQSRRGLYQDQLAWNERALAVAEAQGWPKESGAILNRIGSIYRLQGQHESALRCFDQALANFAATGDALGQAMATFEIGTVNYMLGKRADAMAYYQKTLAALELSADPELESRCYNNIGMIHGVMGRMPEALHCFQRSLALDEVRGDRAGQAYGLLNIGNVYDRMGRNDEALRHSQQALAIQEEIGDRQGQVRTLHNLGTQYSRQEQWAEALAALSQSLLLTEALGMPGLAAHVLEQVGGVYYQLDQQDKALDYFTQALAAAEQFGDRPVQADALNNIGLVFCDLGQGDEALDRYRQSLAISIEVDDLSGQAETHHGIALVYRDQGRLPAAAAELQLAIALDHQSQRPQLARDMTLLAQIEAELAAAGG